MYNITVDVLSLPGFRQQKKTFFLFMFHFIYCILNVIVLNKGDIIIPY